MIQLFQSHLHQAAEAPSEEVPSKGVQNRVVYQCLYKSLHPQEEATMDHQLEIAPKQMVV